MKKIKTLFRREFDDQHRKTTFDEVTPGLERIANGEGIATLKWDGACCAVIDGEFFRRYDAKKGKIPPLGAIPCCDPDPVTGHWPHWIPVRMRDPAANWFLAAYFNTWGLKLSDGTYEACGPHFQNNPHGFEHDLLIPHGKNIIEDFPRTYSGIREYFRTNVMEGVVFWLDGEPCCKIKRSDFGFEWPVRDKDDK